MQNETSAAFESLTDEALAQVCGGQKPQYEVNEDGQLVGPKLVPLPPDRSDARTLTFF